MAYVGEYTDKFSRKYLHLNPDPSKGPGTWRLSNIPSYDDGLVPNTIENLYAIPPIVNTQIGNQANLSFVIEGIPGINAARTSRTTTLETTVGNLLRQDLVPMGGGTLFDVEIVNGEKPILTNQIDADAYIWFNIDALPNVDAARDARRLGVTLGAFGYNSRSVTSITATAPLKAVTGAGIATVSFDITTLPDA